MRKITFFLAVILFVSSTFFTAAGSTIDDEISKLIPDINNGSSSQAVAEQGKDFTIDIRFWETSVKPIYDVSFSLTDIGEFELLEGGKTISRFDIKKQYSYRFYVPENYNKSKFFLRYSVYFSYDDENGDRVNEQRDYYTLVTSIIPEDKPLEEEAIVINGLNYQDAVTRGVETEIGFNIVNRNQSEFINAEYNFFLNNTLLKTEYLGAIGSQKQIPISFNYTFETVGKKKYLLEIKYENSQGKSFSLVQEFSLTVIENKYLELNNIILPEKITNGIETSLKFSLVNKSETAFSNAEVTLYKGRREEKRIYIGELPAQSQTPGEILYTFAKNSSGEYTIRVVYDDHMENERSLHKTLNIKVETEEIIEEEPGVLKLQSLTPEIKALVGISTNVRFAVTNPGTASVKGVEAFLYDNNGKELNSIYISEIIGNSSNEYTLDFVSHNFGGAANYSLKIIYSYRDRKSEINKNFSLTAITEEQKEEEQDEIEKPGNIKIQKISSPGSIYTNVKTAVTTTIVNAGKGTAYNVELYATDENGIELAREYIGNIPSSGSQQSNFDLKFLNADEYNITLYVSYENADEGIVVTEKTFTQQVIDYRASIMDIAGFEWITAGFETNIEFSVLNSGSEILYNTTAYLYDLEGNKYGELYIGNIEPGIKKERQRFRSVMFFTPGMVELNITVTYENKDLQQFTILSTPLPANIQEQYIEQGFPDNGSESEMPVVTDSDGEVKKIPTLIFIAILAGGSLIVIIVIVIIISKRKKKKNEQTDDEDLDYFVKEMQKNRSGDEND